jgi:hypothetical protein
LAFVDDSLEICSLNVIFIPGCLLAGIKENTIPCEALKCRLYSSTRGSGCPAINNVNKVKKLMKFWVKAFPYHNTKCS